jgi:acyl-CoA synthetase (AMP-forming)/AMP-acid ligase II
MTANTTLIHQLLEHSAARVPDKVCLIQGEQRITYAQVNGWANALGGYFLDRGLLPGDRVALLMDNGPEYAICYYGALKAGAVIAPLITDLKPERLGKIIRELEPRFLLALAKQEKILSQTDLGGSNPVEIILKGAGGGGSGLEGAVSFEELISISRPENLRVESDEEKPAVIMYTSGSTGDPKGVMLTHRNIVSNTLAICRYLNLVEEDIQMAVLPFFYVMGQSLLNTHVAVGGTVIVNNRLAFPVPVLEEMVREKVTGFSGVPSTYAYLLHRSPLARYRDKLESLRYCSQAGGHMTRTIKEGLRRVLPAHTRIYIMYGATEAAARLSYLEPDCFEEKMDSIGRPLPGVAFRIVDEAGQELPAGMVGELAARGRNIMAGYWKNEAATREVLKDGWYLTGDQAYVDPDGFYYVVGRKDNLLKVGGHRINPKEIEEVLMASELLVEAAVVGIPDALLGLRLAAAVVSKTGEGEVKKLLSICSRKLPRFKMPANILAVKALPKKAGGKIDLDKVKAFFGQDLEENGGRSSMI